MPVIDGSIQLAYDTLARFTTWNGILASGQLTIVSDAIGDAVRLKIGDGVTTWTALPYYNPASSSQTLQQTLGFGNTTLGNNLIVTTNDEIYFGGLTKFSQGYDGSTLILQDVASGDGVYITEGGGTTLRGVGSAINIGADIDVTSAGEIFFTGTFYNFDGLSGNKVTYINNSNHLITTNVVTDNNNLFFPSNYGIDNPTPGDVLNIGGAYASTINIGRAGATVNILGSALYEYAANQYVLDKLITLNYGGAVASGAGVGFEIEENNVITGYFKTNASRNGYELLTPAIAYKSTLSLASLTADRVHTLPNVAGTLISTGDSGTVTNAMLAGSIAYSKLSLTNSVVDGDIISLAFSKLTATPTTIAGYGITDASSNPYVFLSSQATGSVRPNTLPRPSDALASHLVGSGWGAGGYNVVPYMVGKTHTITHLGVEITTGVGASNIRISIYSGTVSGPVTLVADSGNIASTGTGYVYGATGNVTLTSGTIYYAVIQFSSNSIAVRYTATAEQCIYNSTDGLFYPAASATAAFGAPPATWVAALTYRIVGWNIIILSKLA